MRRDKKCIMEDALEMAECIHDNGLNTKETANYIAAMMCETLGIEYEYEVGVYTDEQEISFGGDVTIDHENKVNLHTINGHQPKGE